jgi:hypothetical protein
VSYTRLSERQIMDGIAANSAVEAEWSNVLRTVRAGMLAVPSRAAQRLPHLTPFDVSEIDKEVRGVNGSPQRRLAGDPVGRGRAGKPGAWETQGFALRSARRDSSPERGAVPPTFRANKSSQPGTVLHPVV